MGISDCRCASYPIPLQPEEGKREGLGSVPPRVSTVGSVIMNTVLPSGACLACGTHRRITKACAIRIGWS